MCDAEEHMIAMNLASFKALTPTKKFMETKNEMRNLSYSNDGFGMVVSGEDVIFVYDLNEGTKVKSIECMKYGVGVVNYFDKDLCLHTSNSQKIVEHHVRLLNIQTKAYVKYFLGHTKTVNGIVKKPQDPPNFLTSSLDKTIRFWDSRTYENIRIEPSLYNRLFDDLLDNENAALVMDALLKRLKEGFPIDKLAERLILISGLSRFELVIALMSDKDREIIKAISEYLTPEDAAIVRIKYDFLLFFFRCC
uniref:WD_REPEATS_REGION domain-containing protein n=1 Tax=Caenorhabditis japonica TaxID=281687 RepID=A0A8R1IUB4_CAEJA